MRIDIITIFPEYFAPLGVSLIGKAAQRGDISFGVHDLRTWAHDPHHSVDDSPFGGGPGMVMMPGPLFASVESVDPKWSLEKTKALLEGAHASHVELVYDDDEGGADFEPAPDGGH